MKALTPFLRNRILHLAEQGLSTKVICERLGLSRYGVDRTLKLYGVKPGSDAAFSGSYYRLQGGRKR